MDTNQSPANDAPDEPAERPPFNEVSVLFPLLSGVDDRGFSLQGHIQFAVGDHAGLYRLAGRVRGG